MDTTRRTARGDLESSEGVSSDVDNIIATPLTYDDSLYDVLGFEDIDHPLVMSDSAVIGEVTAAVKQESTNFAQSTIKKSLSEARRMIDWVLGRDVTLEKPRIPVPTVSTPILGERGNMGAQQLVHDDFIDIGDVQDTCPACTTPYCQAVDSLPFRSSLRLNYNDPEMHSWFIGNKYIMTEMMDTEPSEDGDTDVTLVLATELLRKSTGVPIPNVMAGWKENGKVITIIEQVPGQRLYDIWWHLSWFERERLAREVARYVDQWRRLKSDRISGLSGGAAYHENLFGRAWTGFGPFRSDEELWKSIKRKLQDKKVDSNIIHVLKDYMPESAPCVFTHGDLSCANILVHNGTVSAILGFDNAACLPVWAESVAVHFCCCEEDEQWKAMLSKHMKSYDRAKDWWMLWMAIDNGTRDKKRIAALVARCRRWPKPPKEKLLYDYGSPKDEQAQQASSKHIPRESISHRNKLSHSQRLRDPYSSRLSKKLLKGRHYSELLNDRFWELAIGSQSEMTGVKVVTEEDAAVTERGFQDWEDHMGHDGEDGESQVILEEEEEDDIEEEGDEEEGVGEYREEEHEGEGEREGDDNEVEGEKENEAYEKGKQVYNIKRTRVEKWLLESERGRRAFPRPLRQLGETGDSPYPSPMRDYPWRERQRSFERGESTSKGLRPFSLHLSESLKQKLRETEVHNDEDEVDKDKKNREMAIEKALQSLESGSAPVAGPASVTTPASDTERKRISILRERNAPGFLYLAVANAAAGGRARQLQRSQSEERALAAEERDTDLQRLGLRQRPHSLMPQVGKSPPTQDEALG